MFFSDFEFRTPLGISVFLFPGATKLFDDLDLGGSFDIREADLFLNVSEATERENNSGKMMSDINTEDNSDMLT